MSSDCFDDDFEDGSDALSSLDFWRLCDELTVVQAALLLAGHDPSADQQHVEHNAIGKRPYGYEGAKAAISRALINGLVEGELRSQQDYDINGTPGPDIPGTVDVGRSFVSVSSLKGWLSEKGISSGFFFHKQNNLPEFLDPEHPRYSSKLSAAASAWIALDKDYDLRGKSPKQALEKWLRENASKFNLSDDEGKPNEKGIEECAKVANWKYTGGAPKTPV